MMDLEKLSYWVGVAQTDGSLFLKGKDRKLYVSLGVGEKSLEMMNKFIEYSKELFDRSPKPFTDRKRNVHIFRMGAAKLKTIFTEKAIDFSDPPKPSEWIVENDKYFGFYLAGVIDGDGNIRTKRKTYPQCVIRITSGKTQDALKKSIINKMNCSVSITKRHGISYLKGRRIEGTSFDLELYVSKKNKYFIEKFVMPHVAIKYKREALKMFIKNKYAPAGI